MTSCQRPITHMVAARAQWSTCSSPQAGRAMRHHRRHTPVDRNRMRARCSLPTPPPASGPALPAVTEGGAAEAAEKAAAEPPSEQQAGRAEACLQTGAREAGIDRRVSSASPTSRAARSTGEIVALATVVGVPLRTNNRDASTGYCSKYLLSQVPSELVPSTRDQVQGCIPGRPLI